MSIRPNIDAREYNRRYELIEACAENAPEGVHEHAKELVAVIGDVADLLLRELKRAGFPICNCDGIREIEAVIYGAVLKQYYAAVAGAEGFGEAMGTDAKDRVIEQVIRDRDFLREITGHA